MYFQCRGEKLFSCYKMFTQHGSMMRGGILWCEAYKSLEHLIWRTDKVEPVVFIRECEFYFCELNICIPRKSLGAPGQKGPEPQPQTIYCYHPTDTLIVHPHWWSYKLMFYFIWSVFFLREIIQTICQKYNGGALRWGSGCRMKMEQSRLQQAVCEELLQHLGTAIK